MKLIHRLALKFANKGMPEKEVSQGVDAPVSSPLLTRIDAEPDRRQKAVLIAQAFTQSPPVVSHDGESLLYITQAGPKRSGSKHDE
jgi:hypothetical protein